MLNTVSLENPNNGSIQIADVLFVTDKTLKVSVQKTDFSITLTRIDIRKPYVYKNNGLELWVRKV